LAPPLALSIIVLDEVGGSLCAKNARLANMSLGFELGSSFAQFCVAEERM
jgi:hypothetical protein